MASFQERGSTNSDQEVKPTVSNALAEQRRAALAEIDNAKFSYAFIVFTALDPHLSP